MPNDPNITNIPSNRVEIIDPRTGMVSREWYRFFLNLFNLAGNGGNQTSLDDLQLAPPPQPDAGGGGGGGSGTVTSVNVTGGTTGLTTTGGPITTSGDIVLGGTLNVANGGTGSTTAAGAPFALKGANSDITSMTGITGGISSPDFVQFDTAYATPLTPGQLGWDGNNTLGLGMAGGNVTQHIGEDQFFYCKATSAITKGQVVMFTGAVGASGVPTGAPATGITDGAYIMGIAAEAIPNNNFGLVQAFGTLRNVNTSGYADGDILWYNPAVTGGLTNVKPSAPNVKVQMAAVINGGSVGGGTLLIRINPGSTLGGTDSNAQIGTPSNGQIITYDGADAYWKNTTLTAGSGISVTPAVDGTLTIANTSPSSGGTVTSVGGTGTVSGITLTGTVTTSGNLTLGGALNLSSPPVIGNTTPNAATFTTLTANNATLKGTGQNLALHSQAFTNSVWNSSSATRADNQTTAPNGTNTAGTITSINANFGGLLRQFVTLTSTTYTLSAFVKKNNWRYVGLRINNVFGSGDRYAFFDFDTLAINTVGIVGATFTATDAGNGWYRIALTGLNTAVGSAIVDVCIVASDGNHGTNNGAGQIVNVWGVQLEIGAVSNTYIPTTTTAIYGTPTLSFSGVAGVSLESNGALVVQPAGTGPLQAQATTSTAAGGNARGANAVDWQMVRTGAATQVASGSTSFIGSGRGNTASAQDSFVGSGFQNTASSGQAVVVNGANNQATGQWGFIGNGNGNLVNLTYGAAVGGLNNTASGYFGFVGNGSSNSTTSSSAITTQSATMNGTTSVTLSGSNANIRVGQVVTGTFIGFPVYVTAVSGTSLTISTAATGSGTATLSFFTPHGVVVGGGNNQATGAYSFIGGGGDAGTAANRNVASGDWSTVVGGRNNTANGAIGAFIGGGFGHTASNVGSVVCGGGFFGASPTSFAGNLSSGASSFIGAGYQNNSSGGFASAIVGGSGNSSGGNFAFVGAGNGNAANANQAAIMGGSRGIARGIAGNHVFPACSEPVATNNGINQAALLILARQTTDATPTGLASDALAAGTTNQVILPNNAAYYFRGSVIAGVTGGGNTASWAFEGTIKRGANAASTTLVGTPVLNLINQDAGASTWLIALTADTTNGGLRVTVTGQAATTIRWVCKVETTEMTF